MKKQIRRGVFETNSSSVHSITMCSQDEYSKWERGEVYKQRYGSSGFKTRDEIIEELKNKRHWKTNDPYYTDVNWENTEEVDELIKDNEYVTEKQFWEDIEYETFDKTYTTPSGEKVIAFGYYGEDR